jgi:hypothetical protein
MKNCSTCRNLGELNTPKTGLVCAASVSKNSNTGELIVYNPDMFFCSEYIRRENHVRAKAATAG